MTADIDAISDQPLDIDAPFNAAVARLQIAPSTSSSLFSLSATVEQKVEADVKRYLAMDHASANYQTARPLLLAWSAVIHLKSGASLQMIQTHFQHLLAWETLHRLIRVVGQLIKAGPQLLEDYIACLPIPPSAFYKLTVEVLSSGQIAPVVQSAVERFRNDDKHPRLTIKQFKQRLCEVVNVIVDDGDEEKDDPAEEEKEDDATASAVRKRQATKLFSPPASGKKRRQHPRQPVQQERPVRRQPAQPQAAPTDRVAELERDNAALRAECESLRKQAEEHTAAAALRPTVEVDTKQYKLFLAWRDEEGFSAADLYRLWHESGEAD